MKSMDTNIIIRQVKISDAEDLQRNIYSRDSLCQVEKIINKSLEKAKRGTAVHLVAEINSEVVGNMKVEFCQNVLEEHRGELFDVVVDQNHQKKGIARLLFDECKKLCFEKGLLILETSARGGTSAETVYKRLGFIKYGKLPRGLREPWDEKKIFDQVFFYLNLD